MITPEAIEAGAKAQYENNTGHEWGSKPEFMAIWRHHAFTVLQAAIPFLRTPATAPDSAPSKAEIEELAEIINTPRMNTNMSGDKGQATATAVLADGYRRVTVPRVVTTEQELDELSLLSTVISSGPNFYAWQKRHSPSKNRAVWYCTIDSNWGFESYYILEDGEATVLWEPPFVSEKEEQRADDLEKS